MSFQLYYEDVIYSFIDEIDNYAVDINVDEE
jgi:hypothetical protein